MATVRLHCPHCARIDRLSISHLLSYQAENKRGSWLENTSLGSFNADGVAALKCHLCGGWSIGVFSIASDAARNMMNDGASAAVAIETTGTVQFLTAFPEPVVIEAHPAVPAAAGVFFVEAKEDLRAERNPAGIISKCRSVLDLCLKDLEAKGSGRKARISDLKSKGLLTSGLADWADTLWDDGNDAIHDLTGDRIRAQQHVTFLELFFEVAFVLPAQVAAAQAGGNEAT